MFRSYQPDQEFLFPPSPRDWLPEQHLVWFLSDAVDELDLRPLERQYRISGKGELAYSPRMMTKVLVYAYSVGVFSSRAIEKQIQENIAFRYLVAGDAPSYRTLSRFRVRHLKAFEKLFVQVLQLAQEAGLLKMGDVAIDGSKIRASASKHKAMSYGRMKEEEKRLRKEIRAILDRAAEIDAQEDVEFGPDFRGDELPEELQRRKSRLETIRAAKKRLKERKAKEAAKSGKGSGEPLPKDQENFTDPESRIMKDSSGGFQQCYNAQIAVDGESQVILAADVTQSASDSRQLLPLLEQTENNTRRDVDCVLADAGYRSEENFTALEHRGTKACVAVGRDGKKKAAKDDLPATRRMIRRLQSKRGAKRYRKRKHIVEPVFGWIKQVLGFRSFRLRGLEKVQGEWTLVCLAMNLRSLNQRMVLR